MPQIGWFEIVIIVILAILIIGPKDFPIILKKIGSWVASFRNYFSEVQRDLTEVESSIDDELTFEENLKNKINNKKENRDE